ncbi:MAG: CHAT domain-containing protein [Actinoplanes sp.]
MPSWPELVVSLHDRIRRYHRSGDAEAVGPAAGPEITALHRALNVDDPRNPMNPIARHAVGCLFWARQQAWPSDSSAFQVALLYLIQIPPDDPRLPVPADARAAIDGTGPRLLPDVWAEGAWWLIRRHEMTGDRHDLDRAIELLGRAAAMPGDPAEVADRRSKLGIALTNRFERLGAAADLDDAIVHLRAAVRDSAADARGGPLNNLSIALRLRYELAGRSPDLADAITTAQAAVDLAARPGRLSTLANALQERFRRTVEIADLDRAIECLRAAIDAAERDDTGLPGYYNNLGSCWKTRFDHLGGLDDLDAAIEATGSAVDLSPDGYPETAMYRSNLSVHLTSRFPFTHDREDLELAVRVGRAAVADTPPDHAEYASRWSNLGNAYLDRYEQTADLEDLRAAVAHHEQAVAAVRPDDPAAMWFRSNLGGALGRLAGQIDEPGALDQAVTITREALGYFRADDPRRIGCTQNLATALLDRYRRHGELADLDEAIRHLRDEPAGPDPDRSRRVLRQANLALALWLRFQARGDLDDLDAAVPLARAAQAAVTGNQSRGAGFATNLGALLQAVYAYRGRAADLDEAVTWHRSAIAFTPAGRPDRPLYLSNLANALIAQAESTGSLRLANEAVQQARAAVDATPPGHAEIGTYTVTLGAALLARTIRLSLHDGLDETIGVLQEAARLLTAGANGAVPLTNLGNALMMRHHRTGDVDDVTEAVDHLRAALARVGDDHVSRAAALSNLGNTLRVAATATGSADQLGEAVRLLDAAVALTPGARTDRAAALLNLGGNLLARYERGGRDPQDLDRALDTLTDARAALPAGHPATATCLLSLAMAHEARHDGDAAVDVLWAAVAARTSPVINRMTAAMHLGRLAARLDRAGTAADAFAAAVELLPGLAWHGLDRADRKRWLADWSGLATTAAAWAIRAGRPRQAVELLEQGRSVLWTQAVRGRSDLADLAAAHPGTATRLDELRSILNSEPAPVLTDSPATTPAVLADERIRAAEEYDELLDEIRGWPGFTYFLAPVPFDELRAAATGGPVVLVNIDHLRCDALVVTAGAEVEVIELPRVTPARVTEWTAYEIPDVLGPLWDDLVRPVLDRLFEGQPAEPLPRIWWCPTGLLNLLPLHAAGRTGSDGALDRVVPSYTSTLSALRRDPVPTARPSVLLAGVTDTPWLPGAPPLPAVDREVTAVQNQLGDACGQTLTGAEATVPAVLAGLHTHSWAHLCCHGRQDPADPDLGAILLSDGPLTVPEIAANRLSHADLAFLSACHTHTGGTRLADEALHLAAAFQLAGYRHVIATQVPILDRYAERVAVDIYRRLMAAGPLNSAAAARAVHDVVRDLRTKRPNAPQIWAPYTHTGP